MEKRQRKAERERKRIVAAEKKVEREKNLRQRLLSHDEKYNLIQKLETEAMSNEQRQSIEKKIKDSKLEETRRKRQGRYRGDKVKRKRFDEKYSNLKEIFKGGVYVKKTEDIGDGTSFTYTIIPRNPTTATVSDFLQNSKFEALKLINEFSDQYKFFMVLRARLKKNRLLNNEVDYTDMYTSSRTDGKDHPGRITKKLKEHIQKYNGNFECEFKVDDDVEMVVDEVKKVKFSMAAKDMVKFEKLNPDLRIHVHGARTDLKTYSILKDSKSPNVILMLFMNKLGVCRQGFQ